MRTLIGFMVLGSLVMAGCSSEEASDSSSGGTSSQGMGGGMGGGGMGAGATGGMGSGMGTGAAGATGGMGAGMGGGANAGMGAGMGSAAQPYSPKRTPVFNFAPGGPVADADLGDYHVAMDCTVDGKEVGTMTVEFWPETAPKTVRNFLRYCDEGFYDGLAFHRVLRDVMVQGGDPLGNGMGSGPYGTVPGEFSKAPEYAHRYGVLSMARGEPVDSASSQFFIITDEGPNAWSMDGRYAAFGRITGGVSALEAIANVPVVLGPGQEVSRPTQKAVVTRAEVREGAAPTGEEIARPPVVLDLGGEPEQMTLQHVLLSFQGVQGLAATRSKAEAEALANQVLELARSGSDFTELVLEHSDDPASEDDPTPGVYKMLNLGVRYRDAERHLFDLNVSYGEKAQAIQAQQADGALDTAAAQEMMQALNEATALEADADQWIPRDKMVTAFGDVAFGLEVGEVGMAAFDPGKSPFGWHVIKRLE